MEILYALAFWIIFFLSWIFLFILNLYIFEKLTSFNIKTEIFEIQNKALSHIIKWQVIGQAIMIWTLIYFMWSNYETGFDFQSVIRSIGDIMIFWIFWIFIFQSFLSILDKFTPMTKEIIIDNNESLWRIIEAMLISIAIILSVSLYSY